MEARVLHFTDGNGPAQAAMVVGKVLKKFVNNAENKGYEYKVLSKVDGGPNGAVRNVTLFIKGKEVGKFIKNWVGTIKWVGKASSAEQAPKIWYIACVEIKTNHQFDIKEKDMSFQAIRSSGAGGQHVNKVSSAVRAVHEPTGVQVHVSDSRSQHRNKKIAIERLQEKVFLHRLSELQADRGVQHMNYDSFSNRRPVKSYSGSNFKKKPVKKKTFKNTRADLKKDLRNQLRDRDYF